MGGGVESKLLFRGWSVKLEYLHADFGTLTQTLAAANNPAIAGGFTGAVSTRTKVTDDLVRVGLNYKLF